jgi:PAS domain S-box-containing protein
VRDALPGLTAGLGVLQVVLALAHAASGDAREAPLVVADAASAALAFGLRFALTRRPLPLRWAHPFAAACGAIASAIVLIHLSILRDPLQGLMVGLVVMGGGSILLSFRWLAVLAGASLLGWLAVTAALHFPPGSRRIGIFLVGSWALATMILAARLRTFRRLEELRAQKEARLTRDVHEAQRLTETLRQSEESHRLLFEKSPLPMWVVEESALQFLAVNDAAVRHYGYSREEFLDMTLEGVHPQEEVPRLRADLATGAAGQGLTTRHRTKDGALIDVEVLAHPIVLGGWNALLAVLTDVTERKRFAAEREHIIAELKEALANVKVLRGLIPICASCKKVRDDKGYWSQVEVYVRDRSEAEFSHGICPDCMKKLYGR